MNDEVRSERARPIFGRPAELADRIAAVEQKLGVVPHNSLDGHRFDRAIVLAVHTRRRAATGRGYIFRLPPSLRA